MRVRWATTCEQITIDERGAHSLVGVSANVLTLAPDETAADIPLFIHLSVPRHELDTDLEVLVVVVDPDQTTIATMTHGVHIPSASLPTGAMDGYEVPTNLATVVHFDLTTDGPYSLFVTPPLKEPDPTLEPLTLFVERPPAS